MALGEEKKRGGDERKSSLQPSWEHSQQSSEGVCVAAPETLSGSAGVGEELCIIH